MNNIQLRWKSRSEGRAPFDSRTSIYTKVLQYRKRTKKEEVVDLGDMETSIILVDAWGPWTDVPEVL